MYCHNRCFSHFFAFKLNCIDIGLSLESLDPEIDMDTTNATHRISVSPSYVVAQDTFAMKRFGHPLASFDLRTN